MPQALRTNRPTQQLASFEAFLALESQSQERHEFVDGNLFLMPGGTARHDHVANAIRAHLFFAAQAGGFWLHGSDVLVRTPNNDGYHPDALLVRDTSHDEARVKRRPFVLIEVLSESTAAIDRAEKLRNYRSIATLQQYILLAQDEPLADVYSKQPDGTWQHDILESDAELHIADFATGENFWVIGYRKNSSNMLLRYPDSTD
jgi:Uma2 family endonuclease